MQVSFPREPYFEIPTVLCWACLISNSADSPYMTSSLLLTNLMLMTHQDGLNPSLLSPGDHPSRCLFDTSTGTSQWQHTQCAPRRFSSSSSTFPPPPPPLLLPLLCSHFSELLPGASLGSCSRIYHCYAVPTAPHHFDSESLFPSLGFPMGLIARERSCDVS